VTTRERGTKEWFEKYPVIGKMTHEEALARLGAVGVVEVASPDSAGAEAAALSSPFRWIFGTAPWEYTEHLFGFLAPAADGAAASLPIRSATLMAADRNLIGARVKITLQRLRVARYPGRGVHHVLFDFYAQNQSADAVEHLHFNVTHKAADSQSAAVLNCPIFVGLRVGPEGAMFRCYTVNVKSSGDQKLLGFLESDVFKRGLQILDTVQPALAPLSAMAYGLTRNLVDTRSSNIPVQEFHLGLDFSNDPAGARLAEGDYVVIQAPEDMVKAWKWDDWRYNRENGRIVSSQTGDLLPLNYVIFGVSRMQQQDLGG
jgi:hypothetical protein